MNGIHLGKRSVLSHGGSMSINLPRAVFQDCAVVDAYLETDKTIRLVPRKQREMLLSLMVGFGFMAALSQTVPVVAFLMVRVR